MATASSANADPAPAPPAPAPPVVSSRESTHYIPPEPEPEPVPQPPAHDAADVKGAPRPGGESGRIDSGEPGDSTGRKVARGALWLPRTLFGIVLWPGQEGTYVLDRYQLIDWYYRLFYFQDKTISIVPTATYETGYGLTIGAQFTDTDTFGRDETTVVLATGGTTYRIGTLGSIDTGDRFGPVRFQALSNFDRRPAEPFYGIGNTGHLSPTVGGQDIDAFTDPKAVTTHFRYQELRARGLMEWLLGPAARIGVSLAYTELKFTHSDTGLSSEEVYNPETLVGFDETTRHLYPEVELAWDTRRRKSPWEPVTVNSRGSLILAFAGFVHQFDVGGDFVHYGFELQHYWRLGLGPRVLIGRIHGEAVTGDLGQIPMSELPYLGGGDFLRGYPYGRFRDRVATVGSLEYMWSLAAWGSAFVFTDVGRVYGGWNQFTLDDLHVGYGLGLEFYSSDSFYADFAIASSSNGGIALTAEFTPMLNARTRWR